MDNFTFSQETAVKRLFIERSQQPLDNALHAYVRPRNFPLQCIRAFRPLSKVDRLAVAQWRCFRMGLPSRSSTMTKEEILLKTHFAVPSLRFLKVARDL